MSRGPYPIMLLLAMSLPGAARALGLGDIRVDSALNEPLSAQIEIVGATRDELLALTAKVANREVFQHYGADRPAFLATASFKVGMDAQGRPVLNVKSAEAFTDPVINFLVDIRWGKGELIREYSLLLDPAGFAMAGRLPAAPVVTYAAPALAPAAPAPAPAPATTQAAAPAIRARAPAISLAEGGTRHRVARGDTLRGIARRAGARTETHAQRMMIAIFRANPHAFEGNINLLHLGAVLDLPASDTVAAIDPVEAKREVRAQMTAWRLEGRPANPRTAAGAGAAVTSAPAPEGTLALKTRVQMLEKALEDVHQQIADESAKVQNLRLLAEHTPTATAPPVTTVTPVAPVTPVATVTPVAPAPVRVEVMGAPPATPVKVFATASPVPTAPAAARLPMSRSVLETLAIAFGLALAGFLLLRKRLIGSPSPVIPAPMSAEFPMHATPHALASAPVPAAGTDKPAPAPVAASRAAETAPAPAAAIVATEISMRAPAAAAEDFGIDTDLLERSYLDALGIDTDVAGNNTGAHTVLQEGLTDITAEHDSSDLNTVRLDTSELDTAVTAAVDSATLQAGVSKGDLSTVLDYNLLDLDATAQHVHMPSDLHGDVVVAERRTNIVDALKSAIERDPERRDLRMKLLETYYSTASANQRGFLDVVRKLARDADFLASDDWRKVVMMGREIAPEDILFTDIAKGDDDLADCA